MFSPHDSDRVLEELGDKFVLALIRATDSARADFEEFRDWHPDWVAPMFERSLAAIIHERLWAHLAQDLTDVTPYSLRSSEPHREISAVTSTGRTYTLRIKRHDSDDLVSSYPTPSDVAFWAAGSAKFEGMEEVSLAAGYRWDHELREIGSAVISYREGKTNPIWAVEVGAAATDVKPFSVRPILPTLPDVDLRDASSSDSGVSNS